MKSEGSEDLGGRRNMPTFLGLFGPALAAYSDAILREEKRKAAGGDE